MATAVSSPSGLGPTSGGKVYGYNNITNVSTRLVAPENPQRRKITFHNVGTVDLFVGPQYIQNTLGTVPTNPTDVLFAPTTSLLGGCFRIAAGTSLTIEGECNKAYLAFAFSGTTNPLTVMDSNF